MTFAELAVIGLVALVGPLLALRRAWHLPVVLGEIAAGLVIGASGLGYVDAGEEVFTFLADVGFALVMFVAGTHVPVRAPGLPGALRAGAARAVFVGVFAAFAGWGLAALVGTGHAGLYAVLVASSSAALVMPVVSDLRLSGPRVTQLVAQVAVADAVGIVALPLVLQPDRALRAAGGALLVVLAAAVLHVGLRLAVRSGVQHRVHEVSERRLFALELRIQLTLLFALAGLAVALHVSVMLAGFAFGLAVTAAGEPKRLAHQLFALTDGFFAPLFFVWVGASVDLRDLTGHPEMIWLGVLLGVAAVGVHLVPRMVGQPVPFGLMASAQVGLPVAAATIGHQLGVLDPGEDAALLLGAVITMAAALAGGALAERSGVG